MASGWQQRRKEDDWTTPATRGGWADVGGTSMTIEQRRQRGEDDASNAMRMGGRWRDDGDRMTMATRGGRPDDARRADERQQH